MKWKKVLAGVVAVAAVATMAASCGSKDTATTTDGVPTISWYVPKDAPADKQLVMDEVNKLLVDKIGAKLDIQFIDSGAYNDKMTMMYASGQEMDLCFTSDWTNNISTAVQKGALTELDDLIAQYAPKLLEVVPDYLYTATKINGKIYAIPNQQVMFRQYALVIANDLANKYGLDISSIKEATDLEPYLQKIKENEPSIIPFARTTGRLFSPDFEWLVPDSSGLAIKLGSDPDDVEVVVYAETPEFQEGLKIQQDWYQKGYIRKDINSVMNVDSEISAGKYAVWDTTYKLGADTEFKNRTGMDVTVIPLGERALSANAGISTMTSIAKTSKNKEKAIQVLEAVQTDKELYNLICFGIEGKHYQWSEDKSYITVDSNSGYYLNAAWMFGNQFNAYVMEGQDPDIWEKSKELNDTALKSPISGFIMDTEPIKTELSQIETVNKEYSSVDTGTENEATYNEWIQKRNDAGQQKVKEEVQKQIDEFLAANK
jgi:putative aldouronate transport system substrate-binding protein